MTDDGRPSAPLCRACRKPVDWSNVVRHDRETYPGVFERAYVCPHCRAILEFASWQTGTPDIE
jgi:hypothetical protein